MESDPTPAAASPDAGGKNILRPGITGLVLTCNGERLLERCLSSLSFCDDILTVDSGSTDATTAICEKHRTRFIYRPWDGFAIQFRFAQEQVRTRWFFILDQDEICPPALGRRIRQAIDEADRLADTPKEAPTAYVVGRKSWYFNRFMKHSGWYPDPVPRVFRTGFVAFYQDAHIHYRPVGRKEFIGGSPDAELIHFPYAGFSHQLDKLNLYADQGAAALAAEGQKGGIRRGIGHGLARFFRIYILKLGFLDGRAGFLTACHGSFYAFLKYVRVLDASWGKPFDQEPGQK